MAPKKPARPYQRHGLTVILRGGAGGIDARRAPFRAASEWARKVAEQLGGPLTATQATRLHLAELKIARLSAVYRWLAPQLIAAGGLAVVNTKRRQPYAVADYLDRTEDSLLRLLKELEAGRPSTPPLSLPEYIAKRYGSTKRSRPRKPKATVALEHQAEPEAHAADATTTPEAS